MLEVEDATSNGVGVALMYRSDPGAGSRKATNSEKHTRTFRQVGTKWVIVEDRSESDAEGDQGKQHASHAIRYANVKWFINPALDSARRAARPTSAWIPRPDIPSVTPPTGSGLRLSRNDMSVPSAPSRMIACDDGCAAGGSPPTGLPPLGSSLPCLNDVAGTVNPSGGTINILYQHGFASSAAAWCQMSDYVRERFRVGTELRHTLTWYASYEDQAADLGNRLHNDAATYPGPYVLVGHSNGGIVNRYMAQTLRDPSLVAGVVTISSPHAGAYLANFTQNVMLAAIAVPFVGASFGCDIADAYVCRRTGALGAEMITALAPILLTNAVPVTQEMGTRAPFHATIDGRGDASYRVAGVQNRIWDRWTLWRLLADHQQCVPQFYSPCDDYSRRYVNAVDKTYHHYIDCAIVSGLLGIFWHPSLAAAAGCAKNAGALRALDYAYKRMSVANDHGDAVVPEHSQIFPGAPALFQYLVDDSDSHLGETKSRRTANGLITAINKAIGTPFAQ
jgi:pimeloyl-ACP methyl ester carboxylesterase